MEDGDDLESLQAELAAGARNTARELISGQPDLNRVEVLDARAAVLREKIRLLTPWRSDESDLWR